MKRYGISFGFVFVGISAACLGILCGCRSTKSTQQKTVVKEIHESRTDSIDSVLTVAGATTQNSNGSSEFRADERGRLEISRDSAGRPTLIIWNLDWNLLGKSSLLDEQTGWIYGHGSGNHSYKASATESDTTKKEEGETEVNPAIPAESIIGAALMGVLFLGLLYILIVDCIIPWIKRRRQ